MEPNYHINIPKPCHEQWQQMETVSSGRYCGHCCKTVVDFTEMSNDEIIGHLATNSNVCGRFRQQQLNSFDGNLFDKHNGRHFRRYMLIAASVIGFVPFAGAKAKIGLPQQIDSLYKKHQPAHAGVGVSASKRKVSSATGGKPKRNIPANSSPVKFKPIPCLPADDTPMMGKVVVTSPVVLKNFQIMRRIDTATYVIGVTAKGVFIKDVEQEADRSMLYEFGIR